VGKEPLPQTLVTLLILFWQLQLQLSAYRALSPANQIHWIHRFCLIVFYTSQQIADPVFFCGLACSPSPTNYLSLFKTQVVSVTSFNGGNSHDMIPDSVVIGGTFRAFSNTSFYQLLERIEQVGNLVYKCNLISISIILISNVSANG
jgi:hypothetical protein